VPYFALVNTEFHLALHCQLV